MDKEKALQHLIESGFKAYNENGVVMVDCDDRKTARKVSEDWPLSTIIAASDSGLPRLEHARRECGVHTIRCFDHLVSYNNKGNRVRSACPALLCSLLF